jgi:hypothetical protein
MKKNIRKIPSEVLTKLGKIKSDEIVTACAVRFKAEYLRVGNLAHLGIMLQDRGLVVPSLVIPPAASGKYSRINAEGEEIVRRDLPLETHYNTIEAPNWGDSYNGYHDVDLPYKAYPREFRPPRENDIALLATSEAPGLPEYVISFRLNDVLDRRAADFNDRLLGDLNILQENVGFCSVEASETSLDNYVKSLQLSWEVLPPGTKEDALQRLFQGRQVSREISDVASDRYDFFMTLRPEKLVYGTNGFRRYFGALINDDLVVFENVEYGNAIYVMFENWQELSKRSRIELLSGKYGTSFVRISHSENWKAKVGKSIAEGSRQG